MRRRNAVVSRSNFIDAIPYRPDWRITRFAVLRSAEAPFALFRCRFHPFSYRVSHTGCGHCDIMDGLLSRRCLQPSFGCRTGCYRADRRQNYCVISNSNTPITIDFIDSVVVNEPVKVQPPKFFDGVSV
jgi:hypothetical protein